MVERAKHTTVGMVPMSASVSTEQCILLQAPCRITSEINLREPKCDVRERAETQRAAVLEAFRSLRRTHGWLPKLPVDIIGPLYSVVLTRLAPQCLSERYLEQGFKNVREAVLDALGEERDAVIFTYHQREMRKYGVEIGVALLLTDGCVA